MTRHARQSSTPRPCRPPSTTCAEVRPRAPLARVAAAAPRHYSESEPPIPLSWSQVQDPLHTAPGSPHLFRLDRARAQQGVYLPRAQGGIAGQGMDRLAIFLHQARTSIDLSSLTNTQSGSHFTGGRHERHTVGLIIETIGTPRSHTVSDTCDLITVTPLDLVMAIDAKALHRSAVPNDTRYGLTVDTTGHTVWLDEPSQVVRGSPTGR